MRLSKLTGFLSGLAVSAIVSVTEFVPVVTAAATSQSESHHSLDREQNADELVVAQLRKSSQVDFEQAKERTRRASWKA